MGGAIGESALTSGVSGANATSYATASISPTANRLVLVAVVNEKSSGPATTPTLSGGGMTTWTQVATVGLTSVMRLTVFRALQASPTSGAITIDFGGVQQLNCHHSVAEFSGVDTSGSNGANAVRQPTSNTGNSQAPSVTLAAFANSVNGTYGAFAWDWGGSHTSSNGTAGSGFTAIHNVATEKPELFTEWRLDNDTGVDSSIGGGTNRDWAGIALEVVALSGDLDLALSDTGSGADASTKGNEVSDTGAGADSSTKGIGTTDAGTGADASTKGAVVSDSGAGTEAPSRDIGVSDSGVGVDAPAAVSVPISASDSGSGSEASTKGVLSSEIGTGGDAILARDIQTGDSGVGLEAGALNFTVSDSGTGLDRARIKHTVSDAVRDQAPTMVVEAAWANDPLATPGEGDWTNITGDLMEYGAVRGRQHELDDFSTGEATLLLRNTERQYDRRNAAGPYYPNIKSRRRVRIKVRHPALNRDGLAFAGGTGDYLIKAGAVMPTSAFTFEAQVFGAGAAAGSNSDETLLSYFTSSDQLVIRNLRSLTVQIGATTVNTGVDVAGDRSAPEHHLAVVWRSTEGLLRVFVHGALRYEATGVATGASIPAGGTLVLGQEQDSAGGGFTAAQAFSGTLRDVRLWSVARSHHAIHAGIYRENLGGDTGLLHWWLLDEAHDTLATDSAGTDDLAINGAAWTTVIGERTRFTGFIEQITPRTDLTRNYAVVEMRLIDATGLWAEFRSAKSPYDALVLAQGAYLYWPMDEPSGDAQDLSGNGRTGSYDIGVMRGAGAPFPIAGSGKGAAFNPGEALTAAPGVAAFEYDDPFSVSFLWRFTGSPTNARVVLVNDYTNSVTVKGWRLDARNFGFTFSLVNDDVANNEHNVDANLVVLDAQWHHVLFTYDGNRSGGNLGTKAGGVCVYVDGQAVRVYKNANTLSASIVDTGAALRIRPGASDSADTHEMRSLAVFERELSAVEAAAQWQAAFQPWETQRTDERVAAILDIQGWPTAERDLRRGAATAGPLTEPLGTGLDHMRLMAQMELGGFYTTERGQLAFDDRYANSYDSPVLYTFGIDRTAVDGSYTDIVPTTDSVDLASEVHTQRTPDGVEYTATDATAEARYAPKSLALAAPWSDDYQPAEVAQLVLARVGDDRDRFESLVLPAVPQKWEAVLNPRLHRDRISVTYRPGPDDADGEDVDVECWIEQIRESWRPFVFNVAFALVPDEGTRSDLFAFGRSALDGTAVLA